MKKIFPIIFLAAIFLFSCKRDFLDVNPAGALSEEQVKTDVEKFVTATYGSLVNDDFITPGSLWPYGNVRADDAYKGGRDETDIVEFHWLETKKPINSDVGPYDGLWFKYYLAISRANAALRNLSGLEDSNPLKKQRQAEMRFLRGHWYFQLKILYKNIPFIDETVPLNDYEKVSNVAFGNDELWEKIAQDFKFAVDNLNPNQPEVGRVNRTAAIAYLAKTKLYQAYKQDEQHNVSSVDNAKLEEVVTLTTEVLGSSFALESDYANNFMLETENGSESVFAIQYVRDAVTEFGRLNYGDELSAPNGIGCCDFHKPSQNLANAFKTGADGLPMFTTYNNSDLTASSTVDPRLNHTVAIPGHPWKYDNTDIFQLDWNRNIPVYGAFASLKENVKRNQYIKNGPFYANAKNRIVIRLADVMLWKAEALIELGRQNEALPLINAIRTRAMNSTNRLKLANGNFESNFKIDTYKPGDNITWTKESAREALRWERRLELAMEGSRFFDLVRWGVAHSYLNNYYQSEMTKREYLKGALFTKNRDEYLPIPLNQIKFSKGLYKQNPGYQQ